MELRAARGEIGRSTSKVTQDAVWWSPRNVTPGFRNPGGSLSYVVGIPARKPQAAPWWCRSPDDGTGGDGEWGGQTVTQEHNPWSSLFNV